MSYINCQGILPVLACLCDRFALFGWQKYLEVFAALAVEPSRGTLEGCATLVVGVSRELPS